MKTIYFLITALLPYSYLHSQNTEFTGHLLGSNNSQTHLISSVQSTNNRGFQDERRPISLIDTSYRSKEYLARDDPKYNKRYSILAPIAGVIAYNAVLNAFDSYVLNKSYTKVSFESWKRNLKAGAPWTDGWIWSEDKLSLNFLGHPIAGAMYFNAARSNGYNYWASIPFAFGGAYMWKIFDENGKPEREDIINTPVSGALFGEILYRVSSNILDDRTRGAERVFREIAAGIIDPMRGVNRLIQGKSFRVTDKEVYQKEPLNLTLYAGLNVINNPTKFATGASSSIVNVMVDYGNPFEHKQRKPFDFFRTNLSFSSGWGKKYLNIIQAEGLLFGKNIQWGKMELLAGAFQHFDYYDNYYFELSTIGLGCGVVSRLPVNANSNLFTSIHIAGVPFGANSTRFGPNDAVNVGDYNFVGGWEAKFETTLDFENIVRLTLKGEVYWASTYVRLPGQDITKSNAIGVIDPKISVRIYKELHLGFEQLEYIGDREPDGPVDVNQVKSEQAFFVQYFFGNFKHGI